MGSAVPLTAVINGQKLTIGKAFFDSASGEIKALIDKNCPVTVRQALVGDRFEFSIAPSAFGTAFDQLITTVKTTSPTIEEG